MSDFLRLGLLVCAGRHGDLLWGNRMCLGECAAEKKKTGILAAKDFMDQHQ